MSSAANSSMRCWPDDYIRSLQWVDLTLGIAAEPPLAVDSAVIAQATTGNGLRPM